MKILVTGASGLVGSTLLPLLEKAGHHVVSLTTSRVDPTLRFQQYHWNPAKNQLDPSALQDVSAIIHLAGASIAKPWTKSYKQEIIDSRVQSARLLYKHLENNSHSVKYFISASAIGIYPDSKTEKYTESSTATSADFLGGVVKQWESSADIFQKLGISVSKIRTGLVLDAKQGALPEMAKPIELGLGALFGSGGQLISWIHVHDLARVYLFVLENQLSGIVNAVSPNPLTNAELTKKIATVYDRPLWLPHVPKILMKFIIGERVTLLYQGQFVVPAKLLSSGFVFEYPQIDAALDSVLNKKPPKRRPS